MEIKAKVAPMHIATEEGEGGHIALDSAVPLPCLATREGGGAAPSCQDRRVSCHCQGREMERVGVSSHYRPTINCQLVPKGEEAITLYTHMHFITNKFHLYHSDYILQEL